MEKYTYTGKNIDELKANAYQELNLEEIIFKSIL